ncbi:MAG: hypothetical protein HOP28_00330 [Gemmatimonadales bacterium]|nr:hypothetical protein [Gemmatimonadales bacterium]
MWNRALHLSILLSLAAWPRPLRAQQCPDGPLALVLAGGGAKGFAHIGVLQALDSLGVRPDLIVGTSIGAIVGALYASGLSAPAIDSLLRSLPVTDVSQTFANRTPRDWGSLPPLVLWEQGAGRFGLATGGIAELGTNALVNRLLLRANLMARGDFDRLPIPFRAVATDLQTREAVVLRSGDLAQAVRASIAIPLVLSPERIGGRVLIDGGISANVPVAAARAAGAKQMIVVDLKDDTPADSAPVWSPGVVAGRLAAFLFRQPLDSLGPADMYIWPNVRGYANLDFHPTRREELIANGRAAADSLLARAACLPRRPPPASVPLPARLSGWEVSNGSGRDGETMGRVLGLSRGQALDPTIVAAQLGDMSNTEIFRELWLGPVGSADTVFFRATVVPSPRRVVGLGLAYDHDLGGRLWVGLLDRTTLRGAEASGVLALGRFKSELSGVLLSRLGLGQMSIAPLATARGMLQSVRQFHEDGRNFDNLDVREGSGSVGVEWARLGLWRIRAAGSVIGWRTPLGETRTTAGSTISAHTEPGRRVWATADAEWMGDYQLARAGLGAQIAVGGLALEPEIRLAVGHHLPIQKEFELGGTEGFPGLSTGERRGDRELMFRLQSSWPVLGPVGARLALAAGRSASGGILFNERGWIGGIRVGAGATTPIGPVAFEYGFASNGRRAAFIRVGRWF